MHHAAAAGFRTISLPVAQLSLAAVLKCGQSFRWSALPLELSDAASDTMIPAQEYRLCLKDRVVCLRQDEQTLWYRAVFPTPVQTPSEEETRETETLAWIRDYFQLDVDLVELYDDWSRRDPVFNRLRDRFSGIRMLRQDPWENLVSFICSSNNHISRITSMISKLCKHYSPPLLSLPAPDIAQDGTLSEETEEDTYHPFPPPSILADPSVSATLRGLGFGYRADFIQRTAQMLVDAHGTTCSSNGSEASEKWLHTLRTMETPMAREELLEFVGVGRKVADCVLLMSMDKREVIPVDTHVQQIAVKHYGFRKGSANGKMTMTPKLYDEVNEKLTSIWGPYAGWAHSVLFTADLKSFASYGLSTPQSSPMKPDPILEQAANDVHGLPTPGSTKRKRAQRTISTIQADEDDVLPQLVPKLEDVEMEVDGESLSLAERVKRRRRSLKRSQTTT